MRIKFSPSDVSKGCIAHVSNVDKGWMEKWVIGLFLATKECFSHLPTFQNELQKHSPTILAHGTSKTSRGNPTNLNNYSTFCY